MATPSMVIRIAATVAELRKNLAEGANSIETTAAALKRMEKSFSGDRILADANAMTAAVHNLGGASKLTEAEQARVNRAVTEAIAKYRALGQQAPPDMIRLAQETAKVGHATDDAAKKTSLWSGMLRSIGPAIAAAFSIGAIKAFATDLMDTADSLIKMREKTGISVEGLQQLEAAAIQGGNTLDEVTAAISKMQVNLAGGDKGVVHALRLVGLSIGDLRALKPEDQFTTIAAAIQKVQDPADQAKLRMLLFGKAGNEIAGTLNQDFASIAASAVGMSTHTAEALDSAGDRLAQWWKDIKAASANFIVSAVDAATLAPTALQIVLADLEAKMYASLARISGAISKVTFGQASHAWAADAHHFQLAAEAAGEKAKDLGRRLLDMQADMVASAASTRVAVRPLLDFGDGAGKAKKAAEDFTVTIDQLTVAVPEFRTKVLQLLPTLDEMEAAFRKNDVAAGKFIDDLIKGLPKIPQETEPQLKKAGFSFATFGDIVSAVGAGIGGTAGRIVSAAGSIASAFASGGLWGGIVAGIGAGVGALASLFGKGEGKKVNDLRDAFISAAGGLHALNVRASEAGLSLTSLLRADTVKEYEAAIASLNKAFDVQAAKLEEIASLRGQMADTEAEIARLQASLIPTFDQVNAVLERYGINLDAAGQKVNQLALTDAATKILNDWELIEAAEIDATAALTGMADEISAVVDRALDFGLSVPKNMQPMIESLLQQGLLLDENGERITDISGLRWGEAVKTQADIIEDAILSLKDTLNEFIDRLAALTGVGQRVSDDLDRSFRTAPWENWRSPEWPDLRGENTGLGGGGKWESVALSGPAAAGAFSARSGGVSVSGGGGSSAPIQITVISQLDGREVARNQIKHLPSALSLAGARG